MKKNFRSLAFVPALGLLIILVSCDASKDEKSNIQTEDFSASVEQSTPSNIFSVKGEDIAIHSGPGRNFKKVINRKATEILHETQYATVDYTVKIKEYETKEKWSRIVVVDPDYLSESHKGWVETKYIVKGGKSKPLDLDKAVKKVVAFNDVSSLQKILSSNGIGQLRKWQNDDISWISSTDYYSFGIPSSDNRLQNNLAYYLESRSVNSIETVKLILNINNRFEHTQALSLLNEISKKTFSSLNLREPRNLSSAIQSGGNFTSNSADYKVSLVLDKSRIDTWKLTIESK